MITTIKHVCKYITSPYRQAQLLYESQGGGMPSVITHRPKVNMALPYIALLFHCLHLQELKKIILPVGLFLLATYHWALQVG